MESTTFSATDEPPHHDTKNQPTEIDAFQVSVVAIGVIGILGNGVTLYVFVKGKKFSKSVGGMLVINQTAVDLFCSFVIIITHGYKMRPVEIYKKGLPELLCFFIHAEVLLYMSLTASIYSLVLITLERYLMVLHPVVHRNSFTKRRALALVVISWILGSLHPIFGNVFTTYVNDQGVCRVHDWGSRKGKGTSNIIFFVDTYILPMLLFILAYVRIWWILVRKKFKVGQASSIENGAASGNEQEDKQPKRKLTKTQINFTKTLILIVMAFIILWMPVEIQAMRFNLVLKIPTALDLRIYKIALFLSFINCVINPVIYAFQLENFKKATMKHVCPFRCTRTRVSAEEPGVSVNVQTLRGSTVYNSADVVLRY
ncbi:hypothetical protein CAPTEDRAFT_193582 [Capitella teleta]|uniref:G-protein coupled receptors family 1 profile domain-containing protein n=1 Tax=Capitella teleta TaxID=283909 RepID=R7VFS3_CAPTE|nr:hypothetical protein CAPTEDRAFT_193582 [Capitella teleta]|eukprot:ELU17668.1 hypothetical protein CAPTEDRAFT_193582 [Capitella teleta]